MPITIGENCSELLSPSKLDDDSCKVSYLERRSRYVTFPWMTTNRKFNLKANSLCFNLIDLTQFHLICQMLAKSSGVESEKTVCKKKSKIFSLGLPTA